MFTYPIGLLSKKIQGVIPTDILAYYPFNGNANDESGNNNNGTVYLAVLDSDRKAINNRSYSFSVIASSIRINNNTSLQLGSSDFSTSFWVKFDTQSVLRWAMGFDNFSSTIGHNYALVNNKLRFNIRGTNGGSIYSNSTLNDNVWHHIVCIRNSGVLTMYVDNVLQADTLSGVTQSVSQTDTPYALGNYRHQNASYYMRGNLDDIRIDNRVFTIDEITALYNE